MCRKCLNVVDATPANLIGTAFQMMGGTANHEVIFHFKIESNPDPDPSSHACYIILKQFFQLERVYAKFKKDELRLRSRNAWLDLWFLAVCFFALAISVSSSMVQLCAGYTLR